MQAEHNGPHGSMQGATMILAAAQLSAAKRMDRSGTGPTYAPIAEFQA